MENTMTHLTIRQINIIIVLLKEYKDVTIAAIEEAKFLGLKKEVEYATKDLEAIESAIECLENIKV